MPNGHAEWPQNGRDGMDEIRGTECPSNAKADWRQGALHLNWGYAEENNSV